METLTQEQIEQALSFAQYQAAFTEQRLILKQKFDDACIIPYNGGLFKISQEWLSGFDLTSEWVLDLNSQPVKITNPQELLDAARTAYRSALAEYGEAFQQLRKQRSVRALTTL